MIFNLIENEHGFPVKLDVDAFLTKFDDQAQCIIKSVSSTW